MTNVRMIYIRTKSRKKKGKTFVFQILCLSLPHIILHFVSFIHSLSIILQEIKRITTKTVKTYHKYL